MDGAREQAEAAVRLADRDLSAALPALRQTVAVLAGADTGSRSLAHRALGHALLYGGRPDEAMIELRRAVQLAGRAGEPQLVAAGRNKLAYAFYLAGRLRAALREVNLAVEAGGDLERPRALATRAMFRRERGDFAGALADLDAAIATLTRLGDALSVQRALINRALLKVDTGAPAAAEVDLREAERLARLLRRPAAVGLIAANLGYAAARAGHVPRALSEYQRADEAFVENGLHRSGLLMDVAELLTRVGLDDEALTASQAALAATIDERRTLRIAEARLLLARAALSAGRAELARGEAQRAVHMFGRQGRPTWAAAAGLEAARAGSVTGVRIDRRPLERHAVELSRAGWLTEAVEAYLLLAQVASSTQRTAALSDAVHTGRRGPALVRARAWYARALLAGDPRTARAAVRKGLALLDEHQRGIGADDLRAGLARQRLDLAALGVDLALAQGSPSVVFRAVEQARATVVVRDSVRPPADAELADLLTRLRATTTARGRAALETAIRDRSRLVGNAGRLLQPVRSSELDAALHGAGDAALVVWFARHGRLFALTRVAGRTCLADLADQGEVRAAAERMAFATHRLSAPDDAGAAGVRSLLADAAGRLEHALLAPLAELRDRPLVLVPPAALHGVPFAELPGLQGRPVSVAASVRQWLHARRAGTAQKQGVLVVAGPGLPGATAEAERIAGDHGVTPLIGEAANVQAVLSGLSGARLAHLATHGRLRSDNPQFSQLTLVDGDLLVHHLDTIDELPELLVLASCDTGRPIARPGEALLGFAAACLTRGTRTLIAPVAPVPDGATGALMVALHERLRAGLPPAAALAQVQASQPSGRRVFTCFGAG